MNDDRKDFEHRWERRLHDELRRLPDSEAPVDLVPNVMALVRASEHLRARAWYRRPFVLWPRPLQLAFGSGAVALFALLAWGGPTLWAQLPDWPDPPAIVARSVAGLTALAAAVRALFEALSLAAVTFFTPARIAIATAIIVSQITLLGIGGSVWRNLIVPRPHGIADHRLPLLP